MYLQFQGRSENVTGVGNFATLQSQTIILFVPNFFQRWKLTINEGLFLNISSASSVVSYWSPIGGDSDF